MPGLFINAGTLFAVAEAAYMRTNEAPSDRAPSQLDALVSIAFSAASLEAFINEAIELAAQPHSPILPPNPPAVGKFAALGQEVEKSRGTIQLKFLLARVIFAGEPYDKGAQPYQDFELLMNLRNELVHLKPVDKLEDDAETGISVKPAPVIERLRSKNILAEFGSDTQASWISRISTRAVARWACSVTVAMVQSVLEILPEGQFKEKMDRFYAEAFQPVK